MARDTNTSKSKPDAVPHGGAAAIYGFLYQLTASLARVTAMAFDHDPQKAGSLTATFEPPGGGDFTLEQSGERRTIQFKQRQAALTVADLAGSVLPDLFRAHCVQPADVYELQATRRLNGAAASLIANLKGPLPSDEKQLADLTKARDACQTIFRKRNEGDLTGFDAAYSSFVARFEVGAVVHPDQAKRGVKAYLKRIILYSEQVDEKFNAAIGAVMALSTNNGPPFTLENLVQLVGDNDLDDLNPAQHDKRLRDHLSNALADRNYTVGLDIRAPLPLSAGGCVTRVGGSSGNGKSWSLYRTAHELAKRGTPVLLITAETRDDLQAQFEAIVRGQIMGFNQPLGVNRVGSKWREVRQAPSEDIFVFWEGCRDHRAISQIEMQNAFGAGVHLVAELPADIYAGHPSLANKATHFVGPFTHPDVFDSLSRQNISAGHVPPSIVDMLMLPVLCGIYANLAAGSTSWEPTNEYLVLERFWQKGKVAGGIYADLRLRALALRLIENKTAFASSADLDACGFPQEMVQELIKAGWLKTTDGRWSFAHDRHLTWALAEALADQFLLHKLSPIDVCMRLRELTGREKKREGLSYLGFLTMDFIWLVASQPSAHGKLLEVIRLLEDDSDQKLSPFYTEMLATAGVRILPVLSMRAKQLDDKHPESLVFALTDAFKAMGLSSAEMAALQTDLWLHGTAPTKAMAIGLGATWPLRDVADEVWQGYLAERQKPLFQEGAWNTTLRDAIVVVARDSPAWLDRVIERAQHSDELYYASDILREISFQAASPIWNARKDKLFATVKPEHKQTLCGLVADLDDLAEVPRLEAICRNGDVLGGAGLQALCLLSPSHGLKGLGKGDFKGELPGGRLWLDSLLDYDPGACEILNAWLMQRDASGRELARVWNTAPDRMGEETLSTLLTCLVKGLNTNGDPKDETINLLVGVLSQPNITPQGVSAFYALAATALPAKLVKRLKSHPFDDPSDKDNLERLVRRFGGKAFDAFVLKRLGSNNEADMSAGLAMAPYCESPDLVHALDAAHVRIRDKKPSIDLSVNIWFALEALDPTGWEGRIRALLTSAHEGEICLALTMLEKVGPEPFVSEIADALAKSEPCGIVEDLALNMLSRVSPGDALARTRAEARLQTAASKSSSLNVLLRDNGIEARAILDPYLLAQIDKTSWSTTDLQAIAIRLEQGDADDALWRFAKLRLRGGSAFGDDATDAFVKHRPSEIMPDLLTRAFGPPTVFTNDQPNAISSLNDLDPEKAEDAFIKSWKDHPDRRDALLTIAWTLKGEKLLFHLIKQLPELYEIDIERKLFRRVALRLRGGGRSALRLLFDAMPGLSDQGQEAIVSAIGFVSDTPADIDPMIGDSAAPAVRRHAKEVRRRIAQRVEAAAFFRQDPTTETLLYLLYVTDPSIALAYIDPFAIRADLKDNSILRNIAECEGADRLKSVSDYRANRVSLRRVE